MAGGPEPRPPDYQACQAVQRVAWGIDDDSYIVPIATLVGAQLHGGLVLGAFLPDGTAVGMSFAFLGRIGGRIGLYSQLTGMAPGYQDRGIGGRLKLTQRALALADGLDLIAWSFDPLQAGNARFNLDKLGATSARYVEDMYGPRTDALNVGTPTDRLIAEWEIASPVRPVLEACPLDRLPRLIETTAGPDGEPTLVAPDRSMTQALVLLPIPDDIKALKRQDPRLADRWRMAVRRAFTCAFAAGYRAISFRRHDDEGRRCNAYLLQQGGFRG